MTNPTADDIKHELKNARYATGKGAWDSADAMTADVSAELRRRGIPHAPAQYDAGGNCLTCGECGRCPGVHTFEEIQQAAREASRDHTTRHTMSDEKTTKTVATVEEMTP